jgi:hypothetical protein
MLTTFMLTTFFLSSFLLQVASAGETADLRDRQDFALNRAGVFVSHLFAAALQSSSHLESDSNKEIGHPPKGLNSPPPKGLMPRSNAEKGYL